MLFIVNKPPHFYKKTLVLRCYNKFIITFANNSDYLAKYYCVKIK